MTCCCCIYRRARFVCDQGQSCLLWAILHSQLGQTCALNRTYLLCKYWSRLRQRLKVFIQLYTTLLAATKDCFKFLLTQYGVSFKYHGSLSNFYLGLRLQSLFLLLLLCLFNPVFILLFDSFLLKGLILLHGTQSNLIWGFFDLGPLELLLFILLSQALAHFFCIVTITDKGDYAFGGLVTFRGV